MTETFKPTAAVAKQAAKGLELREKFNRGGTEIGVARARDLKNQRELSVDTVKRMKSYFKRHKVDKRAKNFGDDDNPSAGYIAWLLWGGDEGRDWAYSKLK
ncbi:MULTISPECIES: hypothetical protein [unclassified Rhizobium]|uniref:hypothetical protein n=1 Tax=unclassified Rhizobium TaxID=2613769 RepID=UPI000712D8EC|nr:MULTISPECIES: hypothetical protein [unclassified Rhizobium]KQS96844.1 hypothetical protein ASG42_28600 [Rhizobium sp. Leaf391]KQT06808.1 hypothetical protein ASG50_13905 [Rhizobium sp. Leaf386]KQU05905.1 hypothetical protein ASG68_24390 [Rhizobium sp. Leaf453]